MVAYLHAPEKVAGSTPARALLCLFCVFFSSSRKRKTKKTASWMRAHTHTHAHSQNL